MFRISAVLAIALSFALPCATVAQQSGGTGSGVTAKSGSQDQGKPKGGTPSPAPAPEVSNAPSNDAAAEPEAESAGAFPTVENRIIVPVNYGGADAKILRDFLVSANPGVLDDRAVLLAYYRAEQGRFVRETDISAQELQRFKTDLVTAQPPGPTRIVFRYTVSMGVDNHIRYNPAAGIWPIFYGSEKTPTAYPLYSVTGLPPGLKIAFEYDGFPDLAGIPMTPDVALDFQKRFFSRNLELVDVDIFVTLQNVEFDVSRNLYVATSDFEGTKVTGRRTGELLLASGKETPSAPDVSPESDGGNLDALAGLFPDLVTLRDGYISDFRTRAGGRSFWDVVATAALMDQFPDLLDNDLFAAAVAPRLLTPTEILRLQRGFVNYNPESMNQFDLQDAGQRARTEFGDILRSRAFSGPYRFTEIRKARLGAYDFESQQFALRIQDDRTTTLNTYSTSAVLEAVYGPEWVLPRGLPIATAQARALASRLGLGDREKEVFAMIYAETEKAGSPAHMDRFRDRLDSGSMAYERNARPGFELASTIRRVEIYADRELTDLLHRFDYDDPTDEDLVGASPETLAALAQQPSDFAPYFATLRTVPGGATAPSGTGRPSVLPQRDGSGFWLHGTVRLGSYDAIREIWNFREPPALEKMSGQDEMSAGFRYAHIPASPFDGIKVSKTRHREIMAEWGDRDHRDRRYPLRLRINPISVRVDAGRNEVQVAYDVVEAFIIATRPGKLDRHALIAHQVPRTAPEATETPVAAPPLAAELALNVDTLIKLALKQSGADLDRINAQMMDLMVLNQFVHDRFDVAGTGPALFDANATIPGKVLMPSLRTQMQALLAGLQVGNVRKLDVLAVTQNPRRSLNPVDFDPKNCGALIIRDEMAYAIDERETALMAKMGLPDWQTVKAGIENTLSNSTVDAMRGAPWQVLTPLYVNALQCAGDVAVNSASRDLLGYGRTDLREALRAQMPRVLVAVENFPRVRGRRFNMASFKGSIKRIVTLPGSSGLPDIGIVLEAQEYDLVNFDARATPPMRTVSTVTLEDMQPKPATAPGGGEFDITGLTLGMTMEEAEAALSERMKDPIVLRSRTPSGGSMKPFTNAVIYLAPDLSERVSLYFEPSTGKNRILAIDRVLNVADFKIPANAVKNAALEKYGEPTTVVSGANVGLEWGEGLFNAKNNGQRDRTKCFASFDKSNRIEAFDDADGNLVQWWKTFDWDKLRDGHMPWVPSLRYFYVRQPEYANCGIYLTVQQDSRGIVTFLGDLAAYEDALVRSINGERLDAEEDAADLPKVEL